MLQNFGAIWQTKIDDRLIDTWYVTLKKYSDKDIKEAGYRILENSEFFPRPASMIKFLTGIVEDRKRYTCPICKRYVHCIIDGKCTDCYVGVPLSQVRESPSRAIYDDENLRDFQIQDHMMCNSCGKPDITCIKEPAMTGIWKCRKCYTELTDQEIKSRFDRIYAIINSKDLNKATKPSLKAKQYPSWCGDKILDVDQKVEDERRLELIKQAAFLKKQEMTDISDDDIPF